MRARLESGEEVTGDTEMTVEVEGSPVKAKIRGKMISNLTLITLKLEGTFNEKL